MKKLLLAGITAAVFSIAAIGQEREDESNQFRQETEQEAEQAEDAVQQESQEFRQDAEETGEDIEQGIERTGEEIEEGAERAGEEIEQGVERTGEEIEESAEEAGDETDQATERTLDEMNEDFKSTVDEPDQEGSAAFNTAPELEVVESKEGPNNEVVYKYQDEYFYVDRENKKLVKAEESELQDAEHEVIVKDPRDDSDTNTSSSNRDEK